MALARRMRGTHRVCRGYSSGGRCTARPAWPSSRPRPPRRRPSSPTWLGWRDRQSDFGMSPVPLDLYESSASLWAPASRPLGFTPLKDYEDCFGAQLRCLKVFIPVGCSKQAPEVNWIIVASLPPGLDAEKGCGRPCTPRQHVHLKADIIHLSFTYIKNIFI